MRSFSAAETSETANSIVKMHIEDLDHFLLLKKKGFAENCYQLVQSMENCLLMMFLRVFELYPITFMQKEKTSEEN